MQVMDAPIEPSPRWGQCSAVADGHHYVWRGIGPGLGSNIIAVCDPSTELWSLLATTGPLPYGEYGGRSVCVGRCLYTFGGHDGSSFFYNDMGKLDLDTLQWTEFQSSGSQPMKKICCGLVRVNEKTLCCFGGYCIEGPTQPGATFTRNTRFTDGRGWTNEIQFFNIENGNAIPPDLYYYPFVILLTLSPGVWLSPELRGERPPPCANFTLTMVDQHRAVLFGGSQPERNGVNDVYLFNFSDMVN